LPPPDNVLNTPPLPWERHSNCGVQLELEVAWGSCLLDVLPLPPQHRWTRGRFCGGIVAVDCTQPFGI
jgi:hypothetical protein